MRPMMLSMQAFGPFAGSQIIDFEELGHRQFFLIHGPTGAGKTTVLDAICFALYGSSSGAERESWEMRSDHADPAVPTEVTFAFTVGDDAYRVCRRPRQERPKKRGEGTTIDDPQATLWQSNGIADSKSGDTILATQWERVTERVEEILGFKSSQFRQVVMLPQGQFRQLLSADSRERQKILETLFHTEIYRIMEERLKDKAKQIADDIRDAQRRIDLVLEQAGVSTASELMVKQESLKAVLQGQNDRIRHVRQEETTAQKLWNEAVGITEKIRESRAAESDLRVLEERQDEFKSKGLLLEDARRAFNLIDAEQALKGRRQEWDILSRAVESMTSQFAAAAEASQKAEESFGKEQAREPQREAALRTHNDLTALTAKVRELHEAKSVLLKADAMLKRSESQWQAAKKDLDNQRRHLEEKKKAETDAAGLAAQKASLGAAHNEIRKLCEQRRQYEALQSHLVEAQKQYHDILAGRQEAEQVLMKLKEDLVIKEHLWQAGQAAILARGLVAGEPCPVCGSREHPMPAVSEAAIPEEAFLRGIREQITEQERKLSGIRDRELKTRLDVERIETNNTLLKESLGDAFEKPVSLLSLQADEAQKALLKSVEAGEQFKRLSDEVEALRINEAKSAEALEKAHGIYQESVIKKEKEAAVVAERETAIPEPWRDMDRLEAELKKTAAQVVALKDALRQAQEQNVRAREVKIATEAALKEKTAALDASARKLTEDSDVFRNRLAEAGFVDEAAFEAAKRNAQEIKALEGEINAYAQARQAAKDRAQRACKAAEGLAAPDMDRLSENIQAVKDKLTTLVGEQAELNAQLHQNDAALKNITVFSSGLKKLEERYAVFGRISEVANGKNLYGMTFQRFVLAALLDDVLTATSARLKIMSRGRYELHRLRDKSKRPSGLELEVYDAYTGTMRGVATLSGGESFLASLALALGLADVVQSYAGGIHLDTIFIDEGFGSLDPEALDLAMRALIDLQQGGRLVGVISHVPEMKDWIDARLEITAGRQGSVAKFVKR